MDVPQKGQFIGSLIGQCLGDALGFPVEGRPRGACRKYLSEQLKPDRVGEVGRGPFPFGQYTDDSQLARELLQSYVAYGRFDPADYAGRIAAIFREGRIVGRGRATTEAAERLAEGVSWEEAGTPPPSAGNGSAMRAGLIGLLFFDDPQGLIQAAHDQGRITHKDRRCSAGAVAVAGGVSLAIQMRPMESGKFLAQLGEWVGAIETSFASSLQSLNEWVSLPPDEAASFISRAGLDGDDTDGWEGISPFVIPSVLWSLYSFLRSPDDYIETIRTAVGVGGDVDTTAAMAGAISGAYLGIEAIPSRLARRLTDRGRWGFTDLVELAGRVYEIKTGIEGV
ncbi:MAG: ADP-ribosylglycohydrolase family protein [Thermodesulfobacteriota bacterium]